MRRTNRQIVDNYISLLTEGAQWQGRQLGDEQGFLNATKSWRAELWRQLKEIEGRLCPKPPVR